MMTEFHFADFTPDDDLRIQANQALDRILDLAPYDSTAVALLKKVDGAYHCSVDVYSRQGPFMANAIQPSPLAAVQHVQAILTKKLEAWRKRRRLDRSGTAPIFQTG